MDEQNPSSASSLRTPNWTCRVPIPVSAGLVFRDGLLLITQRREQDHLGGLWEFPGGKRHDGETDEECLKRELLEELGIEVKVEEWIDTVTHEYAEKTVHLKFFCCQWTQHEPRAIGCAALAWVNSNQLINYKFPAADARFLKKIEANRELWSEQR